MAMKDKEKYKLVGFFLICTGIFNILDYFLTLKALGMGYEEANPIINVILDTPLFPIYKLIVVQGLLTLIWTLRYKVVKRLHLYAGIVFIAYFLLMIHFSRIFFLS